MISRGRLPRLRKEVCIKKHGRAASLTLCWFMASCTWFESYWYNTMFICVIYTRVTALGPAHLLIDMSPSSCAKSKHKKSNHKTKCCVTVCVTRWWNGAHKQELVVFWRDAQHAVLWPLSSGRSQPMSSVGREKLNLRRSFSRLYISNIIITKIILATES